MSVKRTRIPAGAAGAAGANGTSAPVIVPPTSGRTSFTYTYTNAPDNPGLDGSGDTGNLLLKDGNLLLGDGRFSSPLTHYYNSAIMADWIRLGAVSPEDQGWAIQTGFWTGMPGWLATDCVAVLDLGSALTLDHITLFGYYRNASGVAMPRGFKVRSASDSGITTNILTPFADITSLTPDTVVGAVDLWVAKLDVSGGAARRYWEVTAHRTTAGSVYLAIAEIACYAAA